MNNTKIIDYVESQKSLHLYRELQDAFIDVLSKLPKDQFEQICNYLIIMAFHEGTVGQVIHFDSRNNKFAVMQLYIPTNMPIDVMRWVVAHELEHVMQERNWEVSDGMKLEDDATDFAKKIGYPKTEAISDWLTSENPENKLQ